MTPQDFAALLDTWQNSALLPIAVIGMFVIGSALLFPVTVMILGAAYLLPPVSGAIASIIGVQLGGLVGYFFGYLFGEPLLARLAPRLMHRIKKQLAKRGVFSVTLLRKFPFAPFTVMNMAIGAIRFPLATFLIGTFLGTAPMIIFISVLDNSFEHGVNSGDWISIALLITGIAVALLLAFYFEKAWEILTKQQSQPR